MLWTYVCPEPNHNINWQFSKISRDYPLQSYKNSKFINRARQLTIQKKSIFNCTSSLFYLKVVCIPVHTTEVMRYMVALHVDE